MRALPILCVHGWLIAAATLSAAQAQQLSPPDGGALNLLQPVPHAPFQKGSLFRGYEGLSGGLGRLSPPTCGPPASGPQADDWLSSCWLSSVSDFLLSDSSSSARERQIRLQHQRSLYFSVKGEMRPSGGKGDYWKPGEFDRLIGPR